MATNEPVIDLSSISPEEFAKMVGAASDEDIEAAIRAVGTDPALDRIFAAFEERFVPEKAHGVDAEVQFVVRDEGKEHPYVVAIRDGTCSATAGTAEEPKVTLTLGLAPFAKLVTGHADGVAMFMTGKLRVSGDIMFAARIMDSSTGPRAEANRPRPPRRAPRPRPAGPSSCAPRPGPARARRPTP